MSKPFVQGISEESSKAPVIVGRGMIACNTPALQKWWDGKNHHSAKNA
jgi:hypothetical protein